MKTTTLFALSASLIFMTLNPSGALAKAPQPKEKVAAAQVSQRPSDILADAGGQSGNGAGGVNRAGRIMTYHSARINVSPEPLEIEDIPNLQATIEFISQSNVFSSKIKSTFIGFLIPSLKHTYYKVAQETFTPEVLNRLKAEYSRISGQPIEDTQLFAITDTKTGETFLLPSFYQLRKREEQMAVLMHEMEWLRTPKASYKEIIKKEKVYQVLFENPNNPHKGYAVATAIEGLEGAIRFAIQYDSRDGGPLVNGNQLHNGQSSYPLTVSTLFGTAFTSCMLDKGFQLFRTRTKSCSLLAQHQLTLLKNGFPNSLLLRALSEKSANDDLSVMIDYDRRRNTTWGEVITLTFNLPLTFEDSNQAVDWNSRTYSEHTGVTIIIQ